MNTQGNVHYMEFYACLHKIRCFFCLGAGQRDLTLTFYLYFIELSVFIKSLQFCFALEIHSQDRNQSIDIQVE